MTFGLIKSGMKHALWRLAPEAMEKRAAVAFYPNIKRTGVAFVHIPKAAGMSLSQAIYGDQIGHLKWSDIYKSNPLAFETTLKFAVCRDPFERFVSAFTFLKEGGINKSDEKFAADFLTPYETASEFAEALGETCLLEGIMRKVHFHTQFSFVCAPHGEIMVDHLLSISRINEEISTVLSDKGVINIPHLNRTSSKISGGQNLSPEGQKIVSRIYHQDFALMQFLRGPERVRGLVVDVTNTGVPA